MRELAQLAYEMYAIRLSPSQVSALETYEKQLIKWNAQYNLTAIRDPKQIRIRHFLDSLTCLLVMRDPAPEYVIDIGSGAGFPGLPLKIVQPSIQMTVVDSVGKKVKFCQHIVQTLKLEGMKVIQGRAEELGQLSQHRQRYDWALARAVAILPSLLEYLLPFVRIGGSVLAMKGESAHSEAHASEHALRVLGGHLREILPVRLPGVAEDHYLVVVDKVAATPPGYPRRVGVPLKRPL